MKDYYEILEVSKNASDDTIKKVFRMMIKKNHPDLFEGDEKLKAEEKVKELNEAYEILINRDSRKKYDLELSEYNNKVDENLTVLLQENEYLKNVIEEKNKLIKEFLQNMGVDSNTIDENLVDDNYSNENNNIDMTEGYNSYNREYRIKKIISMFVIMVIGMIVLWIVTGINLFKIFIEIFKTMF